MSIIFLKICYLLPSANCPACGSQQWPWLHSGMPC